MQLKPRFLVLLLSPLSVPWDWSHRGAHFLGGPVHFPTALDNTGILCAAGYTKTITNMNRKSCRHGLETKRCVSVPGETSEDRLLSERGNSAEVQYTDSEWETLLPIDSLASLGLGNNSFHFLLLSSQNLCLHCPNLFFAFLSPWQTCPATILRTILPALTWTPNTIQHLVPSIVSMGDHRQL